MDKQTADRLITEYLPKLYGFAVKKAYSYAEAEELCADIVAEVYASLRKADEIVNEEGYIWRISEHAYAKFVSRKKRHEGVSIDGVTLPYYDDNTRLETEEEMKILRREIAFLTQKRRQIVFWFYYENRSVADIARALGMPEGTVKWHLNKARLDLKEGFSMKRQVGTLGLSPYAARNFGHSGRSGENGGPEYYLYDKLNLNIVYSVYFEPKNTVEIAEELGVTPVFLEDKIAWLEENGFLVRRKDDRFTTYVYFNSPTYSREWHERLLTVQQEIARVLVKEYVPLVRDTFKDVTDVYIPSGNRQLFEAAMIYWAIKWKCALPFQKDLSPYYLKTTDGGEYIAYAYSKQTCSDPEYMPSVCFPDYTTCGEMTRDSGKYPIEAIAWDNRFCSRKGGWKNNPYNDYEYVYEWMSGMIDDTPADADKTARLRERQFLTEDSEVNIMVVKDTMSSLAERLPVLDEAVTARFYDFALEQATLYAKDYPPQMQDLIVWEQVSSFIGNTVAMMVLDILYEDGTFQPLSEQDKVSANLLMFCDRLP
ncbi:MAG: sigma-70 family RNA polymerase sigma factor [Clostridia bacterium]|nr:sigma-70 family RNA polymerase sigma factor [Clostridia bacterium]